MNSVKFLTSILFLGLALSGCQSTPDVVQEQQSLQEQNQYYLTAKSAVDSLTSRLRSSEEDQLDYFAPGVLKQAESTSEQPPLRLRLFVLMHQESPNAA